MVHNDVKVGVARRVPISVGVTLPRPVQMTKRTEHSLRFYNGTASIKDEQRISHSIMLYKKIQVTSPTHHALSKSVKLQ